jgi:HTH-type transcriptional regulator / antitoxin HigA
MKITTEEEYEKALHKLRALWDAEPGTDEEDELIVLSDAIEAYEEIHYPIDEEDIEEYVQKLHRLNEADDD